MTVSIVRSSRSASPSAVAVSPSSSASSIDEQRFASYVAMLRDLRDRHGLDGTIDVATTTGFVPASAFSSAAMIAVASPDWSMAFAVS